MVKLYCAAVIVLGGATIAAAAMHFELSDPLRLAAWLIAGVFLASVKVRIPGMMATVAGGCVVMMAAILKLGFGEVILVSSVAALAQSLVNARSRPKLIQVAFSVAVLDITAGLGWLIAGRSGSLSVAGYVLMSLVVGTVFFMVNTTLVAGVISAHERRTLSEVWTTLYSRSLPHYIVGGILGAGLGAFCAAPVGYFALVLATFAYVTWMRIYRSVFVRA
jgi:hypothetical protein